MADFKQLDILINDAGVSLDNVSRALGSFIGKGNATLLDAKPLVDAMIAHSVSLQAIQAFSTAAQKPVLPAGMVVGDVVNGDYSGPLDPDTLTTANWRAWGEHNELHSQMGQIFSKAPRIDILQGDYANTDPDEKPFLPWIRVHPN